MRLDIKTVGTACLTVASLLLLIGLWCVYLTPVEVYGPDIPNTVWQRSFYKPLFQPNSTESYNFTAQEGIYVRVWVRNVEVVTYRFYSAFIIDQQGNTVFERHTDSVLPFDFIPNETGQYVLRIRNQPYVNTSLTVEMMGYHALFRPLTPTGQLLILASVPIYGFAASVIMKRERIFEAIILTGATILLLSGLWCICLAPVAYILPPNLGDANVAWVKNFPTKEFKPNGVANYTFTADNGQYVQVQIHNLWFTDHKTFGCAVYDSQNDIVFENNFSQVMGRNKFGFLSQARGQYTLMIYNQPDVTTQLTVEITGYHATYRPSISIGVLLILISLPLYGFGIYLITRRKEWHHHLPPQIL